MRWWPHAAKLRYLAGGSLLQQIAGRRFVDSVANHELLHDRLGEQLIERRLVRGDDRARDRVPAPTERARICGVSCPDHCHYSITAAPSVATPRGGLLNTTSSGIMASVATIKS